MICATVVKHKIKLRNYYKLIQAVQLNYFYIWNGNKHVIIKLSLNQFLLFYEKIINRFKFSIYALSKCFCPKSSF